MKFLLHETQKITKNISHKSKTFLKDLLKLGQQKNHAIKAANIKQKLIQECAS